MILGKPACACSRPAVASTRHPVQDTQHHSSCTHSTTIPMIPRTRAALMRPVRSKGVPMPLMLCAVLCIPLLLWLVLLRTAKPAVTPPARLLQKLKQQGLAGAAQQEQTASRGRTTPLPSPCVGLGIVTSGCLVLSLPAASRTHLCTCCCTEAQQYV